MSEQPGPDADVYVHQDGKILRIQINREAKRNSLTPAMLESINKALSAKNPDVRVVLLSAAGDAVFSSGGDLGDLAKSQSVLDAHEARGIFADTIRAIRSSAVPVVCSVQGLCLAGGVGLALACDLVVASDNVQIRLPEVEVGLWPFYVSALLSLHTSPKHAMDLMLTGRRISAHEALQMGLVSRVIPTENFQTEVESLVSHIATASGSALAMGKRTFNSMVDQDLDRWLLLMHSHLSLLSSSDEAAARMLAFLEKRK